MKQFLSNEIQKYLCASIWPGSRWQKHCEIALERGFSFYDWFSTIVPDEKNFYSPNTLFVGEFAVNRGIMFELPEGMNEAMLHFEYSQESNILDGNDETGISLRFPSNGSFKSVELTAGTWGPTMLLSGTTLRKKGAIEISYSRKGQPYKYKDPIRRSTDVFMLSSEVLDTGTGLEFQDVTASTNNAESKLFGWNATDYRVLDSHRIQVFSTALARGKDGVDFRNLVYTLTFPATLEECSVRAY